MPEPDPTTTPESEAEAEPFPHPRSQPADGGSSTASTFVVEALVEQLAPLFDVFPMEQRQHDVFITHAQVTGQDQCKTLCLLL